MRWALALIVLAPFMAETVASANTPAVMFPVLLPYYAIVYGIPALLFRELWVRRRLTAPRVLVFGLGYTALNEGVVAATWFKLAPGSAGVLSFTAEQAGHVGGVNWAVAAGLVVFHTVYSLMVPVTLVQALAIARGGGAERRPWSGRRGALIGIALVGVVLVGALTPQATAEVCAGPASGSCAAGRLGAALLVLAAGVVVAAPGASSRGRGAAADLGPPPPAGPSRPPAGGAWNPEPPVAPVPRERVGDPGSSASTAQKPSRAVHRVVTGAAFALAFFTSFFVLPLAGLPAVAVVADGSLLLWVALAAGRWCRPDGRDVRGDVLVVTGALLPGMAASLNAWQVGQPVAALLAVALLWHLLRRLRRRSASRGSVPR